MYTLEHVIRDCIQDKSGLSTTIKTTTPEARFEIYRESWEALNRWIEDKLSKQRVRNFLTCFANIPPPRNLFSDKTFSSINQRVLLFQGFAVSAGSCERLMLESHRVQFLSCLTRT